MGSFANEIEIDAPLATVWHVLADIGTIDRWNPGVRESYVTSATESGPGAERYCRLDGQHYLQESVVAWQPMQRLTMRIVGTDLPFKAADIRFTLRPSASGTTVEVAPEYTLKYGIAGVLLDRLMVRRRYNHGMQALLRGLKRYVENGA